MHAYMHTYVQCIGTHTYIYFLVNKRLSQAFYHYHLASENMFYRLNCQLFPLKFCRSLFFPLLSLPPSLLYLSFSLLPAFFPPVHSPLSFILTFFTVALSFFFFLLRQALLRTAALELLHLQSAAPGAGITDLCGQACWLPSLLQKATG